MTLLKRRSANSVPTDMPRILRTTAITQARQEVSHDPDEGRRAGEHCQYFDSDQFHQEVYVLQMSTVERTKEVIARFLDRKCGGR